MIFKSPLNSMFNAFITAIALSLISVIAVAHDTQIGELFIDHPIARETPPGSSVSAGYMTITNHGKQDDRLISISIKEADISEIHEMSMINDVMKMGELEGGLLIQAGQSVELKPHGLHIMFMGLKNAFKAGQTIEATLTFEKAGTVKTVFLVEKVQHH